MKNSLDHPPCILVKGRDRPPPIPLRRDWTPPFQQSAISGAAEEVLSYFFVNDSQNFKTLAIEAGDSRIWGGIHFQIDNKAGIEQGEQVAAYVLKTWFATNGNGSGNGNMQTVKQ
jgi:hypothetical protein